MNLYEEDMNANESLAIIESAIRTARNEKSGAAYYLILWGMLNAVFTLTQFIVLQFPSPIGKEIGSWAWIVFPLGGLLSFLHEKKMDRIETAKLLHDTLFMYVWAGVSICIVVCGVGAIFSDLNGFLALIILLFGFASFVTGGVAKSTPLLIGGILCLALSCVAMLTPLVYDFLIASLASVVSCMIPGLLLNKQRTNVQ